MIKIKLKLKNFRLQRGFTHPSFFSKNLGGFTLIELTIYIAIVGIILVSMTGFLWNVIFGNVKETAYQEVQQNGRFAISKITQETKKATGINNPLPGNPPSSSLSLAMADPNLNPIVFDVVNGKLRITQGTRGPFELTSNQVIVSSLQFTNLSYLDTPGTIRVEMTIDHINPGNRIEYQASINLISSISLVPGGAEARSLVAQLHYRWRNDDGGE